ncbi:MAG: leucyl aminopeptidase [Desulforhopalus sp.]|nr:leucyl aminopeptidase [Desulforhopalus sp.]
MKIEIVEVAERRSWENADLLAVFGVSKKEKVSFDATGDSLLGRLIPSAVLSDFEAKAGESLFFYPLESEQGEPSPVKRMLFGGLGKSADREDQDNCAELLRLAGGNIAASCATGKVKTLAVMIPQVKGLKSDFFAEHLLEGLLLGLYRFTKYKNEKNKEKKEIIPATVHLLAEKKTSSLSKAISRAENAARAANTARNMANEPGNGWTPSDFATFGKKVARRKHVSCNVLDKTAMKRLGLGGILGVNQGSHEAPKLVIVDYCPEKYSKTVMLVGKGITFDSGGVSLKPGAGMEDMKYDMCGGAAVLSALDAIAVEKPGVRVIGLVPSTDNMAGGGALKPGDIITHYGGITSEIENTDAEGRLILADALAYGIAQFEPDCVIDLATLTGAVIIGLGHHLTGILSNDDDLCNALIAAGARVGEPQWRLPLGKEYEKQIESRVADIKNTGGRPAGTITAAEYLHKFIGKTPWAHLDIAGTAWDFTEKSYVPKGPSGIGTRTLIEFIRSL